MKSKFPKTKPALSLLLAIIMLLSIFSIMPIIKVSAETVNTEDSRMLEYNGHYYYIFSDICDTWKEAEEYCEEIGGYLAVISDKEEDQALFNYMTEMGYESAYFGFTDEENEGIWNWVNNELSDYTNWADGEPNNQAGSENYAMYYYKYDDGKWNDGDFNGRTEKDVSTFICEWDEYIDINVEYLEEEFINIHLNYVNSGTYENLMNNYNLAQMAINESTDFESSALSWKLARFDIFDNPYDIVLSELILSESNYESLTKNFESEVYSNQRTIINSVISLINSKGYEISVSDEAEFFKIVSDKDYSDTTAYKILEEILGKSLSTSDLQNLFSDYDTGQNILSIISTGEGIVDSVIDCINYASLLQAYEETSDEFKVVLNQLYLENEKDNSALATAISKFLSIDYSSDVTSKILENLSEDAYNVGSLLCKDIIVEKVKNFLIKNMDLSSVSETVAADLLAFGQGCKIGYKVGIALDNLLFNTDEVVDNFVIAFAKAKTGVCLKSIVEANASNLKNDASIKNTTLFCESFSMYKYIQSSTATAMINFLIANEKDSVLSIFSKNSKEEAAIYNWQIRKLQWDNACCHDGYSLYNNFKNVTIACPVNISVYDTNNELILEVIDNEVTYQSNYSIAAIRNNIKYITIPNNDYTVKLTATDDGAVTYSVDSYNIESGLQQTLIYNNIPITNGSVYNFNILSDDESSADDSLLKEDDLYVDCDYSAYNSDDLIGIENIVLSSYELNLNKGDTVNLTAKVSPENASVQILTWYSANNEVAIVDEYGKVTAIDEGTTNIICENLNGSVTAQCSVEVLANDSDEDSTTALTNTIGSEEQDDGNDNLLIIIIAVCGVIAAFVTSMLIALAVSKRKDSDELENDGLMFINPQSKPTEDKKEEEPKHEGQEIQADAQIEVLNGSMQGTKIPLSSEKIIALGKSESLCQLVFNPDYTSVSRLHCTVMYDKNIGKFFVTDCSTNGTFYSADMHYELSEPPTVVNASKYKLEKGRRTAVGSGSVLLYLGDENCLIKLLSNRQNLQ